MARPVGWSEATHSKSADPDYATVFPDDTVNRLDITISAENWAAMMADMTVLYGAQGNSAAGGTRPVGDAPVGGRQGGAPPAGGLPGGARQAGGPGGGPG
ncbi:MAG TPA: hypothetical protein PL105_14760, partial [Caldilineaceae bacterium]|nr:hypothetical protein [Caldilineaceae bacterium]